MRYESGCKAMTQAEAYTPILTFARFHLAVYSISIPVGTVRLKFWAMIIVWSDMPKIPLAKAHKINESTYLWVMDFCERIKDGRNDNYLQLSK